MRRHPIAEVVNLEGWDVVTDVIFQSELFKLVRMLREALRDYVINGHVLEVKRSVAVEATAIICPPERVSVDVRETVLRHA